MGRFRARRCDGRAVLITNLAKLPTSGRTGKAAAAAPSRPFRWSSLRDLLLLPAVAAVLIVSYVVDHKFLSGANLINVLTTMSAISLIVLAEVFILIVGKMDLSLESTFGLAPGIAIWACMGTADVGAFGWASEWRPSRWPCWSGWPWDWSTGC